MVKANTPKKPIKTDTAEPLLKTLIVTKNATTRQTIIFQVKTINPPLGKGVHSTPKFLFLVLAVNPFHGLICCAHRLFN